jgi:hypothetical protein
MSLLASGSIHQGHERFSAQSRGKQCSFMSLSAILTAHVTTSVVEWNMSIIDDVILQGDNVYLNAFQKYHINFISEKFTYCCAVPLFSG